MSRYRSYRAWLWRTVSYLAAATVAGVAIASARRRDDSGEHTPR